MEKALIKKIESKKFIYPKNIYMVTRFDEEDVGGIPTTIDILNESWQGKVNSIRVLRADRQQIDLNSTDPCNTTIILHHLDINSIRIFMGLDEDHRRRCRVFLYQNIDRESIVRNSVLRAQSDLSLKALALIDRGIVARAWVCNYPGVQVYGVSQDIIDNTIRAGMSSQDQIHRIHIPTSKIFFGKADLEEIETKAMSEYFNIVCVSRLEPEKGILDIFELQKCLKDKPVNILVVGHSSNGNFIQDLETKAIESNANSQSKIIFLGKRRHQDLAQIYRSAHALFAPSRIDTWGLTLIEGMASGLPIYCLSSPGYKEIFLEALSKPGVISDNVRDLAESINEIIENRSLYIVKASNALDNSKQYSPEIISANILSLLD